MSDIQAPAFALGRFVSQSEYNTKCVLCLFHYLVSFTKRWEHIIGLEARVGYPQQG